MASTVRMDGLEAIKADLRRREQRLRPSVTVRVPLADGARLASLYRVGEVLGQRVVGDQHEVTLRLEGWQLEQLKRDGVEVVEATVQRRKVSG
jgi:hypothetical protein